MKPRYITIALALLCIPMLAGCSDNQLRDRADSLQSAATRIERVLDTYQPDQIEESVLAQAIVDALPEQWQSVGINTIETVGDVRQAGGLIALKLIEAADALDAQADKEATEAENAVFGVMSVADLLLSTNGLIAGIAGLLWKKKKQAERASDEAQHATADIVNSIRSSPIMSKALDSGGGDEVRISMQTSTMRVVKQIKETT